MAYTSQAHLERHEQTVKPVRESRVIDLVHLARQTLGDPGLEREVLRIYADACASYCGAIQRGEVGDTLKISLHSLKGASAGIGANGVADIARSAERELRETGSVGEEMRADIAFAVEEVRTYISDLLNV